MTDLTPDEAHFLLQAMACTFSESWAPAVCGRSVEVDDLLLLRKLAKTAGIDPDEVAASMGLRLT